MKEPFTFTDFCVGFVAAMKFSGWWLFGSLAACYALAYVGNKALAAVVGSEFPVVVMAVGKFVDVTFTVLAWVALSIVLWRAWTFAITRAAQREEQQP